MALRSSLSSGQEPGQFSSMTCRRMILSYQVKIEDHVLMISYVFWETINPNHYNRQCHPQTLSESWFSRRGLMIHPSGKKTRKHRFFLWSATSQRLQQFGSLKLIHKQNYLRRLSIILNTKIIDMLDMLDMLDIVNEYLIILIGFMVEQITNILWKI